MHTDVHKPANTMRPLPMRLTSWMTALSSQVFMLVRSKNFAFGNAVLISSNMGPEKVFSATVVGMVVTLKMRAAFAANAALLRRAAGSVDRTAKANCALESMRIRVWAVRVSHGFSRGRRG